MFEKQGIPVTVPGNVTYIMIHHVRIKIDFIRFSCSFTATALHRAGRRRPAMIRDLTPAVSRQLQHAAAAARWSCVVTDTPVQHVVNFELSSPLCVTVISDRRGVARRGLARSAPEPNTLVKTKYITGLTNITTAEKLCFIQRIHKLFSPCVTKLNMDRTAALSVFVVCCGVLGE